MKVLVTGGTGSFGSAFVEHCLKHKLAERIVIYSRDELKQAVMAERLGEQEPLRFMLGDIREKDALEMAMHGCDTVIHAAALKRVDKIIYSPREAVSTNVLGSQHVVDAAIAAKVKRVLMISSDKAVEATNFYGSSKAMMEGYAIAANSYGVPRGTAISVARWGNVLGSRGSVLNIWRDCVAKNKPMPITDPSCTRFWMTLQQAVDFSLECLRWMRGGELYVPKLKAIRLIDLATCLQDPPNFYRIPLRAGGEKIHESLIGQEEAKRTRDIERGYLITPHVTFWTRNPAWPGTPVPASFQYQSDWPSLWMTVPELQKMLKETP